mmetsp:Transcript_20489/g.64429  ORF Transcript_20489/g.64429 Transcript_20489/m.64429 type:complete len:132 (-) Transcript_20489:504-899(-)
MDDDDADASEEEDSGHLCFDEIEVPDGFEFVEKPDRYLKENDQEPLYVLLCAEDADSGHSWWLGRVVKFKPRARVYKYDIKWDNLAQHQQGLSLEKYIEDEESPTDVGGWSLVLSHEGDVPVSSSSSQRFQ